MLVVLAAALTLAGGCAKKISGVDPGYTQLEGRPDPRAMILVYPEFTGSNSTWRDLGDRGFGIPGSPGFGVDVKIDTVIAHPTGTLHVLVLDGTAASAYELYRTAPNGGLQRLGDFDLASSHKWLDSGWESYEMHVAAPSGYTPSFVARGIVSGVVSPTSPLTNVTSPGANLFTPTMAYMDSLTPADSLFRISWTPVPGSAGYWLQVYVFSPRATTAEQMLSGQPAPIWTGNVSNYFVGFVPAPATSYKLGSPGATVLTFTPPVRNRVYRVRVTAVDNQGRITGYLRARDYLDDGLVLGDSTYVRFTMGSVTVTPNIKNHHYDHVVIG
jgi:hypothetical protein